VIFDDPFAKPLAIMNDRTYEIGKKKMRRKIEIEIREKERERERERGGGSGRRAFLIPTSRCHSTILKVLFYSRKLSCS